MNLFFMAVFVAVVPAALLTLVTCWAIAVALGPSKIVIRLPIFLAGTAVIATLVSLGESYSSVCSLAFIGILFATIAIGLRDRLLVILAICFVVPMTIGVLSIVATDTFSTQSFTATAMGVCLLAAMVSIFRLFGFRISSLSHEASVSDLRLATGRHIREWIELLDSSGARTGNYAQTVRCLEDRGLTPHWQKVIAKSYERSVGRLPLERSADGKRLFAKDSRSPDSLENMLGQVRHRFTVNQLLVWSFCAALVFGFARQLPPLDLPIEAVQIAIPTAVAVTIVSLLMMHAILSLRLRKFTVSHHLLVIAITALIYPKLLGMFPGDPRFYWMMAWLVSSLTVWFAAACLIARDRGYALVRVGAAG